MDTPFAFPIKWATKHPHNFVGALLAFEFYNAFPSYQNYP
jgi:hypothetical protein